jgi:hypothetical protein
MSVQQAPEHPDQRLFGVQLALVLHRDRHALDETIVRSVAQLDARRAEKAAGPRKLLLQR